MFDAWIFGQHEAVCTKSLVSKDPEIPFLTQKLRTKNHIPEGVEIKRRSRKESYFVVLVSASLETL
jgi:hypothetical protein